jgi:multiple sugar transport system permease protein
VSLTVFPLLFGLIIALSDWNLSSPTGRKFNGVDNLVQMWHDPFFWNALGNMVWYVLAMIVEYAIAFGLALLLAEIRARKFFRVAFLLPLMLSPVAVSWMVGKSMLEYRFGPLARARAARLVEIPAFFTPWMAKITIMMHGCLDLHPLHDDHAAGRAAGDPEGSDRRPPRRWRHGLAVASGKSPSR